MIVLRSTLGLNDLSAATRVIVIFGKITTYRPGLQVLGSRDHRPNPCCSCSNDQFTCLRAVDWRWSALAKGVPSCVVTIPTLTYPIMRTLKINTMARINGARAPHVEWS